MTQEDKELLLKDLCARLPYGIEVEYKSIACEVLSIDKYNEELTIRVCPGYSPIVKLENIKPYLFPFSSMTEGQKQEYEITTIKDVTLTVWTTETYDCLNKHHIDYRRLIPKGLANDATGLNIY